MKSLATISYSTEKWGLVNSLPGLILNPRRGFPRLLVFSTIDNLARARKYTKLSFNEDVHHLINASNKRVPRSDVQLSETDDGEDDQPYTYGDAAIELSATPWRYVLLLQFFLIVFTWFRLKYTLVIPLNLPIVHLLPTNSDAIADAHWDRETLFCGIKSSL